MNDRTDLTQVLGVWLRERAAGRPAADPILREVMQRVPMTRQRRGVALPTWDDLIPRVLVIAGLGAATLAAGWVLAGQQPSGLATFAPGSIAYTSQDGGLYVAGPEGDDVRRFAVSASEMYLESGDWRFAPDGRHLGLLAYTSLDTDRERLDVFDANGHLTASRATDGEAWFDWAPDGQSLALFSQSLTAGDDVEAGIGDHVILGVDGTVRATLPVPDRFIPTSALGSSVLAWSPDGSAIAVPGCLWVCDSKWDTHYLIVQTDGTGWTWLDRGTRPEGTLAWSPDGQTVAVEDGGSIESGPVGSQVRHDISLPGGVEATEFAWSPYGSIAIVGALDNRYHLYVMDVTGTIQELALSGIDFIEGPRWTRGGQRIVFVGGQFDGDGPSTQQVWSIGADGMGQRLLIDGVNQQRIDVLGDPAS